MVRTDERIGVVLGVVNLSSGESPWYELHVDASMTVFPDGVGCWDPWVWKVSNDPESIEEARRLGLRGLPGDCA